MAGHAGQIGLVLALVLLNAAFAGSEMALVSLRDSQVRRLARMSRGGQVLARLAGDPNRYLATVQIGITLAGFLASAAAAVSLAEPLVPSLRLLGSAAEPVAILLVTAVLSFVTLVFGELAPKRIAMQRAERWALLAAYPLDVLAGISRPAVWLLGAATDLAVRLAGGDPRQTRAEVTTEEIRDMIAAQAGLNAEQRTSSAARSTSPTGCCGRSWYRVATWPPCRLTCPQAKAWTGSPRVAIPAPRWSARSAWTT